MPEKTIKLVTHNYENFIPINGNLSIYENISSSSSSSQNKITMINNNINNNSLPRRKQPANDTTNTMTRSLDKKLDVSNDDLLEAIEQLSMLSKPRNSGGLLTTTTTAVVEPPITTTPKRMSTSSVDNKEQAEEQDDRNKYIKFLQSERIHLLNNMDGLKRSVADIEGQEEEIHREVC